MKNIRIKRIFCTYSLFSVVVTTHFILNPWSFTFMPSFLMLVFYGCFRLVIHVHVSSVVVITLLIRLAIVRWSSLLFVRLRMVLIGWVRRIILIWVIAPFWELTLVVVLIRILVSVVILISACIVSLIVMLI